jgi:hypothetical protein
MQKVNALPLKKGKRSKKKEIIVRLKTKLINI